MLSGSIDPNSSELPPKEKSLGRAHTWPLERTRHQLLLAAVFEDIAKSSDLSYFFVTHQDMLISAMPKGASPSVKAPSFLCQVSLKVSHESRQLVCRLHSEKQMKVI